ncbi:MAG: cobaltochelatase subunit CobN, partial [bacterium]
NTLSGSEMDYVNTLLSNNSVKNNRSFFNYVRKNIDRKKIGNKEYYEPLIIPSDFYFHIGDDNFFSTFEEYQNYYKTSGKYKDGAPRVALVSGNINLQNSNEEHIVAMINLLESEGLNVYPINSFGSKKLGLIKAVEPNLIINNPHGRLVMGDAKGGEDLLKELNVPILSPITVNELYDTWLKSKQGMEAGGLTSMSVVLPELDGAIVPFATVAQFERNGYKIFDTIPQHTAKFTSMVNNFIELQTKDNSEKRVAIYYYKGVGKGSINAADIEGVESLYNTLKHLKDSGYNVDGLPASSKELENMVQKQGSVLGAYALGAYDEFIKNGDPELVPVDMFNSWCKNAIPNDLIEDMQAQYGDAPGKYMNHEDENGKYIAVARLQFGNVAILPQPMAAEGGDIDKITHGVEGAPSYPYVASYLWSRYGFNADALIHFGTHGSLEFIPGKQVALSNYDWTDTLVGDMPHFYIYTINNIGEGIIAKRRSYATLVDHLTAPFMQGELYGNLQKLESIVHRYEQLEEGEIKQEYRKTITELAKAENFCNALGIDSTRTFNDSDIEKVHMYLEEIDGAKVTDGLYTLGKKYTTEELQNTIRLMMIDPIRYALANIDVAHNRVDEKKLDNLSFMADNYSNKADKIINRALRGENCGAIFNSIITKADATLLTETEEMERKKAEERMAMMNMMMASMEQDSTTKVFLDEKGNLIESDEEKMNKRRSSGGGHPSWIPKTGEMPDFVKDMDSENNKEDVKNNHPHRGNKNSDKMGENSHHNGRGKMPTNDANNDSTKSEENSEAAPISMMERMAKTMSQNTDETEDKRLIDALKVLKETVDMIASKKEELALSTKAEQDALINALNGGYILPSSAGDAIANPKAITTGRNFYAINPETTPTVEAWKVGKRLADNLLAQEIEVNGKYPEKVSFTLWSSDFISSEGATIAQILWMLGVEPLRDGFGYIRSLRVVPIEELGRPRVDVVVQTSGQLRDIAASRLKLINDAIAMAAAENDGDVINYVSKGFNDSEKLLLDKGFSPVDARNYSRERIFGGVNGNYGTGITGMVEDSESWQSQDDIAKRYIHNMSGMYSANGGESWGESRDGVFEAALLNTAVVVQPRSSNTWGPLSLDHVYEFMGGLSAAVQHVTGNDPTAYFNDFRNSNRAKVQELKEAIGVETNSTIFNPKYIQEKMNGEASSYNSFAETVRNTFGWNAMKPSAIDQHIWNEYHEIYVRDKYKMNIESKFSEKNPYALQEMSAVMLESARKGMWDATKEQIAELAELHTRMVVKHDAGCSGFVCNNNSLREFIAQNSPENAQEYKDAITKEREVKLDQEESKNSVVLKKDEQEENRTSRAQNREEKKNYSTLYIIIALFALLAFWAIYRRRNR